MQRGRRMPRTLGMRMAAAVSLGRLAERFNLSFVIISVTHSLQKKMNSLTGLDFWAGAVTSVIITMDFQITDPTIEWNLYSMVILTFEAQGLFWYEGVVDMQPVVTPKWKRWKPWSRLSTVVKLWSLRNYYLRACLTEYASSHVFCSFS